MDKDNLEKITVVLANEFLNSFNINGILEAAKQYSIKLARDKVDSLSEEDRESLLKEIEEKEKAAQESAEAQNSEQTTEEPKTSEEELEPA